MSGTNPTPNEENRGRWLMSLTALAIQLGPSPAAESATEVSPDQASQGRIVLGRGEGLSEAADPNE